MTPKYGARGLPPQAVKRAWRTKKARRKYHPPGFAFHQLWFLIDAMFGQVRSPGERLKAEIAFYRVEIGRLLKGEKG